MDHQHSVPPVGDTVDLGFATISVFTDGDGTVLAAGFDSLDALAAGRAYSRGPLPGHVRDALHAYRDGHTEPIMEIPVRMTGTPKLIQLRQAMRAVPAGSVVTYTELAERAGLPGLPRLAGRACSENATLLFVPCHRIIAASHVGPPIRAGAYAGTTRIKTLLLRHEGVDVREEEPERDEASGF